MSRRHSIHPQEEEASFTYLSEPGDLSYLPDGADPLLISSLDDSRLQMSSRVSTNFKRSPSVPAVVSIEEPSMPKRPFSQSSGGHCEQARLGLPSTWAIYLACTNRPASKTGRDNIDFAKFDFTRPLGFSLSAEQFPSTETLPAYRSRTNSVGRLEDTLPPYRVDDKTSSVIQAIYTQNADLLEKPKLTRARPLSRDFTEPELKEIRHKTRHCIRVVTRNSLGLAINLGLSCVAPQMLIAAAINGFCLGVGAHKLHQHLRFLKYNELHVQKRDVFVAVAEGVAIKLVFLAITLNHDDFLVLTHELVSTHSDTIIPVLHEIPGLSHVHHASMIPIEKIQEMLGLPSIAERAVDFEGGGWYDPADVVLKNMFLVGAVQVAMESAIDQLSRTTEHLKEHNAHNRIGKLRGCEGQGVAWGTDVELLFKMDARRDNQRYAKAWTLTSLAVRIAQSLKLHREESLISLTFFQAQVARQTWHTLLALDLRAAFDRCSDPAVVADSFDTRYPLDLFDSDFDGTNFSPPLVPQRGPTLAGPLTFLRLVAETQPLLRELCFVTAGEARKPITPMQSSLIVRDQAINSLERHVTQHYFRSLDILVPFQSAILHFGKVILSYMKLYVVRPLQRHPACMLPEAREGTVLLRAVQALEHSLLLQSELFKPWHWYFNGFASWHPLAVLLAELSAHQQDRVLVDRAWRVAESAYHVESSKIADGISGPLWKPLVKLMVMARQRKEYDSQLRNRQNRHTGPELQMSLPLPDQSQAPSDSIFESRLSGSEHTSDLAAQQPMADFELGLETGNTPWMNWQGFVDDVTQNGLEGWESGVSDFILHDNLRDI
ncbi:hypothetical protein E4T39_04011 [Aureobasidium subglaciale]|nr:hypothetical protein E4T39_04011 [Aureobasidium subglaciale]